jgi:beta-galactosidase beta subunit
MRTIIKIEGVELKHTESHKQYWRTHVMLDDGTEAIGYGKDFDLGDKVEVFHDEKWDIVKIRKGK